MSIQPIVSGELPNHFFDTEIGLAIPNPYTVLENSNTLSIQTSCCIVTFSGSYKHDRVNLIKRNSSSHNQSTTTTMEASECPS